ncbi:MAG: hypothetical protein M9955_20200 [Rhizobiaceae bacterium]|nr:hypothetical protein [Rhizobiaceae bacterium]
MENENSCSPKRKRPPKPTLTHGGIAFGKDGSVRPLLSRLPDAKEEQERDVLQSFVAHCLGSALPAGAIVKPLEEDDHDGVVEDVSGSRLAVIQLTEITLRDVCIPITWEESAGHPIIMPIYPLLRSEAKFIPASAEYLSFPPVKTKEALARKIGRKLDRHYGSVGVELWLVVFTVAPIAFLGNGWKAGVWHERDMVRGAKQLLRQRGAKPFDRVFYFDLDLRPQQLWP